MTEHRPGHTLRWLFDSRHGPPDRLVSRWIVLRALAAIYFSAFYSLLFQIKGLIGPDGVLPAGHYLAAVAHALPHVRYWFAPSLYWISSGTAMLMTVTWVGIAASIAALLNLWPRLSFFVCFVCFLSFVAAAGEFSGYQSDGMLLEAGFLALFFAPRGTMPGWGAASPPVRASLFLLQWEWFRIYFESGMVKLVSGDEQWRNLTAMDEYYQNGPLPTWIGWYVEHMPHWFHAATAAATLAMELVLAWMLFLPRRWRIVCFCIVTVWEAGVILTANYTFLNYLVVALGFLLLDDRALGWLMPARLRPQPGVTAEPSEDSAAEAGPQPLLAQIGRHWKALRLGAAAVMLCWIAYDTTAETIGIPLRRVPLPSAPITALDPLRIANQYGLFAVMTHGRYEIEFQGSNDGSTWVPYPFRYKPQALNQAPGIYAPYQPRFEWNLWFASLGDWRQNDMVPLAEERLLANSPDVLALFRYNPFPHAPPLFVRAVLWRYWFTSMEEKRRTGNWWRRELIGLYAPEMVRAENGQYGAIAWPDELPPHD